MRLVFVMGLTNAGKGTFLAEAKKLPHVGTVEVGKLMRAKYLDPASPHYDPDHFKGQAAPKHTADEAWQMMLDGIAAGEAEKKAVVLIDGQPRDVEQGHRCALRTHGLQAYKDTFFLVLHAPHEARLERAINRDGKDLPDDVKNAIRQGGYKPSDVSPAMNLAVRRMTSDYQSLFNTLAEVNLCGRIPFFYTTDSPDAYKYLVERFCDV